MESQVCVPYLKELELKLRIKPRKCLVRNKLKALIYLDSIGRHDMSGCRSKTEETRQRFKTFQRNGCVITTLTDTIWPWADSP